ncbi:MAG: tetratricopeptide repeat protein, partial [Nitrospirota bacterium]
MRHTSAWPRSPSYPLLLLGPLVVTLVMGSFTFAENPSLGSEQGIAEQTKTAWESGAIASALGILDQGINDHPEALTLQKIRADILTTLRDPQEAVAAYETILAQIPTALDVRWAKWSVLIRSGQGEESVAELGRIAEFDVQNPLVHLRLAQELRKL